MGEFLGEWSVGLLALLVPVAGLVVAIRLIRDIGGRL